MEDFNAGCARALVMANTKPEYQEVIEKIRDAATKGEKVIHVWNSPLSELTLERLSEKGFEIRTATAIEIQRDGLYHSISW